MTKLGDVIKKYSDPWWRRQRLLSRVVAPMTQIMYNKGEFNIMDKEWDNLFIFDACRADMFEEYVDISYFDSYSRLISNAENSPEWLRYNFTDKDLSDTIYVTANPCVQEVQPNGFFELIDVFERINEYDSGEIDWNDLDTVPASLMNKVAREALNKYPHGA